MADGKAAGILLCARSSWLSVIASAAMLRCWRWLSAASTSTRRGSRPGGATVVPAGQAGRPNAAAGWTAGGFCHYADVTVALGPRTWLSASTSWRAISRCTFSRGRSYRHGSAVSPALSDQEREELRELLCDQREQVDTGPRERSLGGLGMAGREAVGRAQSVLTGSGAASVWSRSDCRPRQIRTVTAATMARTSAASCRAQKPCARRTLAFSPRRAGCGIA